MVADECERNDAYSFEDAGVDEDAASQLAAGFGRYAEGLCYYRHYDDNHGDKGEAAGFREL